MGKVSGLQDVVGAAHIPESERLHEIVGVPLAQAYHTFGFQSRRILSMKAKR
ncbi:hypothetical protein KAF44_30865 [Cupriavidus necator]|nr:hypothetical protein KAF44_30865 [Cupriavidus necator]